jgi:hypothetical protein
MLMQEGDTPLGILLQLMDTLALDASFIRHLLEGPASKSFEEAVVIGFSSNRRDIPLPIRLTGTAKPRPTGFRSRTNGTWVGI